MGRPKKAAGKVKTTRLSIKVTPDWLEWLHEVRAALGKDKDISTMIERWAAEIAKRAKLRPPPDR